MSRYTVKNTDKDFVDRYFLTSLQEAKAYKIDVQECPIKLDQNESPWDWPKDLKERIAQKLVDEEWNRYPAAFDEDLNKLIADYAGVSERNVLTGPGSNHLITLLLTTMTQKISGKVVIARPSFALYEMHCRYENISYETWNLNEELEYDLKLLPEMPAGSILVFASPNNPVGNVLAKDDLEKILTDNRESLVIADEAYFEFIDEPYTSLLEKYENLLIIRTFSKTMGAAGLRIGYLLAAEGLIEHLIKLRLPFLLNKYSLIAAKEILRDEEMQAFRERVVELALKERTKLYEEISNLAHLGCKVKKPHANFLLIQFETQEKCLSVYKQLIQNGILVRNVSAGPGLQGCLRMSIGTTEENNKTIEILKKISF